MSDIKRKWDRLDPEKKQNAINELISFFENERNEKIGIIAAEEILNFFLESVGGEIYNQGITDARLTLERRFEDMKYDLDDLLNL